MTKDEAYLIVSDGFIERIGCIIANLNTAITCDSRSADPIYISELLTTTLKNQAKWHALCDYEYFHFEPFLAESLFSGPGPIFVGHGKGYDPKEVCEALRFG